jgi:hypothetical protein
LQELRGELRQEVKFAGFGQGGATVPLPGMQPAVTKPKEPVFVPTGAEAGLF